MPDRPPLTVAECHKALATGMKGKLADAWLEALWDAMKREEIGVTTSDDGGEW